GGKKLCDLARQQIEIERTPRPVHIHSLQIEVLDEQTGLYRLRTRVSKGTYIRTLCADIGHALGCGGVMASLERSAVNAFTTTDALKLSDLEKMTEEQRFSCLLPIEKLFSELEELELPAFYARLSSNGCPIYLKKIGRSYPEGTRLRLYRDGVFFALGEVGLYPEGPAVKAIKQFVLPNDQPKGDISC
ncbi:MAG: tRNA pseudouridine(55) synthase, partial [Clostridia bacterium]|nr:tRNA pseudouridine(55) synthase [Clostridia bacterium]